MSTESARGTSVCVLAPVNCVFGTVAPMPMWRRSLKQKCPEQQQQLNTKNSDPPLSDIRNRPVVTATLPLGTEECLAWDQNQRCSGTVCVLTRGGVAPLLIKHPHMGIKPIRVSLMEHPVWWDEGKLCVRDGFSYTNAAPLGTCVKHWNEIKAWILDASSIGLLEESSHGKQCHGLFSLPDCAHFATDFH